MIKKIHEKDIVECVNVIKESFFTVADELVVHPVRNITLQQRANMLYSKEKVYEDAKMPRYIVTLTEEEIQGLKLLVQRNY